MPSQHRDVERKIKVLRHAEQTDALRGPAATSAEAEPACTDGVTPT